MYNVCMYNDILVLNTTPNSHDILTPAFSEVDPRDKIQLFLYFTLFCYVISMYLYILLLLFIYLYLVSKIYN